MNNPVKTKIQGSILEVTIDRPKANAIDAKTSIILGDIFAKFRDNPKLKVAIMLSHLCQLQMMTSQRIWGKCFIW